MRVLMMAVGVVLGVAGLAAAQDKAPATLPGSDLIPAERLADWRPGVTVGVPGGIPERKDPAKIINVKEAPYLAAGSDKSTTGSIEAGSDVLTVAAPIDFKVGQAVRIPGEAEIVELTITAGADADAKVRFSIASPRWQNPGVQTVDVKAGDSPEAIAKKIGSIYLNGWGRAVKGNTVTFSAQNNMAYEVTFDPGESSVKGTVKTVNDGASDLVARITEIEGNRITLAEKAPVSRANKTVFHDDTEAIRSAISAAKDEEVVYVPGGTYLISSGLNVGGGGKHITLRGAGMDKTLILPGGGAGTAISISGGGSGWWQADQRGMSITGSPKRGDTVLTVGDTSSLDKLPRGGVGEICQVRLKNDLKLPVIAPAHWEYLQRQVTRIVAKTATTVTVSPPLLFDLPEDREPKLSPSVGHAEFAGVEDLCVDGKAGASAVGVGIGAGYGCWLKNVKVVNILGYHVSLSGSMGCEIRGCYISTRLRHGSNGAGILFGSSSSCLIEDNILLEQFPHLEANACTGNVFAYNFCKDSSIFEGDFGLEGCSIGTNHGAQSCYNLYEGNVSPKLQSDGYHGGSAYDTVFRNWLHGTDEKTNNFWICINLNRFTRNYNIVGNILGTKGYTWIYDNCNEDFRGGGYQQHFIYLLGMPGMGNIGFNGKRVQPSKGIYWEDWDRMLAAAPGRGPGPNGFQELDLDVAATTIRLGNYNYKDNAVPASESLSGKKLPASLYLEKKPAWFGNLSWPAFGPDVDFEKNKIPAQVRYEEMMKGGK